MNLYLISRNEAIGYDEYDSAIVAAESPEDAITIHPDRQKASVPQAGDHSWAYNVKNIEVTLIGQATPKTKRGVILASFNAG